MYTFYFLWLYFDTLYFVGVSSYSEFPNLSHNIFVGIPIFEMNTKICHLDSPLGLKNLPKVLP